MEKSNRGAAHKWEFRTRFRRNAFGWRSQSAIQRVKQAVAEIKQAARVDPVLGAEGAVLFLERVSPALAQVDSSSGAISTAVNNAIAVLVPIIADAPAERATREAWLDRLFEAHAADEIPYIESLAEHWGELCASPELASVWADSLIDITRMALSADPAARGYFHGSSACLSALYRAGRFAEIVELVEADLIWPYKRWAVRALAAMGKKGEAIRYAEASRSPWASDHDIDRLCEETLLSSGLAEEAYRRYGLRANQRGTYLATFQAVTKKYPDKPPEQVLADLVASSPGEEGKWFAAAKAAGLLDEALALAERSPCDPRTLARAARDHLEERPDFALRTALLALHWLARGYGYEVTAGDVRDVYSYVVAAADRLGQGESVRDRVRDVVADAGADAQFVASVLGRDLGLSQNWLR